MLTQKAWRVVRTLIITYIISAALLSVLAFVLFRFRLPENQVNLGVNAVYILSCLIGGILAGKSMKSRRFFWGFLTGALYFGFLLLMSFFQDSGIVSDTVHIATVFAMCALSGMAGGMIS